ncbi:hypothetical protein BDR06DRAFT_997980 [Suillus hirtellus]|nr:hypothetical protein BDR06DRAFT_997980 [Suillus hirtellus]
MLETLEGTPLKGEYSAQRLREFTPRTGTTLAKNQEEYERRREEDTQKSSEAEEGEREAEESIIQDDEEVDKEMDKEDNKEECRGQCCLFSGGCMDQGSQRPEPHTKSLSALSIA